MIFVSLRDQMVGLDGVEPSYLLYKNSALAVELQALQMVDPKGIAPLPPRLKAEYA